MGQIVVKWVQLDMKLLCVSVQKCQRQKRGIGHAFQSLRQAFNSVESGAVLQVDTKTSSNSLNCQEALIKIQKIALLIHCCMELIPHSRKTFCWKKSAVFQERITQVYSLALALYTVGLLSLITLVSNAKFVQNRYADDGKQKFCSKHSNS